MLSSYPVFDKRPPRIKSIVVIFKRIEKNCLTLPYLGKIFFLHSLAYINEKYKG